MFDILGRAAVEGARVLELYAGTGALGIEALSRGARSVDFVEMDREVARALEANLARLDLAGRARVTVADLSRGALPAPPAGPWDLVFLDPPYARDEGARWLATLAGIRWPPGGGLVVLERRKGALEAPAGLTLRTERRYGDTLVGIYHAGTG
jgi:16S rRNA (guanine966-N2)-methyltransferase